MMGDFDDLDDPMDDDVGLDAAYDKPNRRKGRKPRPSTNGRTTPSRPAFTLFRDLEESPVKDWLVDGMLGDGEASVMYGKPGDGKSVLAEDLALHVAAGRPWHGRKVKQGAVLFMALERRKLVERRAIAFRERHELRDLPFAIMGGVYDLRQPQTAAAICEIIGQLEAATGQDVVLIVIDTLSRALCGGDENSSKDMGAIVASTSRLQSESSAHVLWLHHTPLAADERMRGHGALLGAVDTTIHVVKSADGVRTGTVVKTNDAGEGETVGFTLDSVTVGKDAAGNTTTAPVVVAVEAKRRPAKPSLRLPKSAQTALRALNEAISESGETAPASNHIPQSVRVAKIETWRTYRLQSRHIDRWRTRQPTSLQTRVRTSGRRERGRRLERTCLGGTMIGTPGRAAATRGPQVKRSAAGVATSREGHRKRRSGQEGQHRRWGRVPVDLGSHHPC